MSKAQYYAAAPADRLNAAAVADRLIYGDTTTFRAADATALLALLPRLTWRQRLRMLLPGLELHASLPSPGASGVAAGASTVRMQGDTRNIDYDLQGRPCLRAGQWRLYLEIGLWPGRARITLEQVMHTTPDSTRMATLHFRHGKPTELCLFQPHALSVGPFTFTIFRCRPWKLPA